MRKMALVNGLAAVRRATLQFSQRHAGEREQIEMICLHCNAKFFVSAPNTHDDKELVEFHNAAACKEGVVITENL